MSLLDFTLGQNVVQSNLMSGSNGCVIWPVRSFQSVKECWLVLIYKYLFVYTVRNCDHRNCSAWFRVLLLLGVV